MEADSRGDTARTKRIVEHREGLDLPSARTRNIRAVRCPWAPWIGSPHIYLQPEIDQRSDGTLSKKKYSTFLAEFERKLGLFERLIGLGQSMNRVHTPLRQAGVVHGQALPSASPTSAAKDLLIANTPVIVKTESNVVTNLSPPNMMAN